MSVLLVFANGSEHSLTEIARHAGLPVSTTHRLVIELAESGILERTEDLRYRVGSYPKLVNKLAAPAPTPIEEKGRRVLEDLGVAHPGATVRLGVLRDLEVSFIDKLPGHRPMPLFCDGMAAHCTAMGRALLAFSDAQLVDRIVSHTMDRHPPFRPEQLRRALEITRLTGFAICRREHDLAASAIAAPVFGVERKVVAAIELETRNTRDVRPLQASLMVATRSLSRQCRYLGVGAAFHFEAALSRGHEVKSGAQSPKQQAG